MRIVILILGLFLGLEATAQTVTTNPGPYQPVSTKYQWTWSKWTGGAWVQGKLVVTDSTQLAGITYVNNAPTNDSSTQAANTGWIKRNISPGAPGVATTAWQYRGNYTDADPTNGRLGFKDSAFLGLMTNNIVRFVIPAAGVNRRTNGVDRMLVIDTVTKEIYYRDIPSGSGGLDSTTVVSLIDSLAIPYTGTGSKVITGDLRVQDDLFWKLANNQQEIVFNDDGSGVQIIANANGEQGILGISSNTVVVSSSDPTSLGITSPQYFPNKDPNTYAQMQDIADSMSITIDSLIAGANTSIDYTNRRRPVVSSTGGGDSVYTDSPVVVKMGVGLAKDTLALITAPPHSILGNNTATASKASYYTNNYGDSLKISNDTVYLQKNNIWVYQAKIPGIDSTFLKAHANGLGATPVENKGAYLSNTTAATGSVFQYSPPLIFEGQGYSTISTSTQQSKWRIYNKTGSGSPTNGIWSNLIFEHSGAGAAYGTPTAFSLSSGGNITNAGNITSAGSLTMTGTASALTFSANWSNGSSGTRTLYNATGSISAAFQSGYRGYNYEPTVSSSLGVTLTGFRNTVGGNYLNATSGSTGVGVVSTIDGGAKLEINSTAQGLLLPRMTKAQRDRIVSTFTGTVSAGTGYTTTAGTTVNLTGGSGTGAQANITVTAGAVAVTSFFSYGTGYVNGDVLTIVAAGGTGATYTITSTAVTEGMTIYQTDNTPGIRVHNGTNWMKFTETAD